MKRRTYNANDLRSWISAFEQETGVSSEVALAMHRAGQRIEPLTNFERHVWMSYYRELREVSNTGKERP